jgi:nicotinamidase-related amidase
VLPRLRDLATAFRAAARPVVHIVRLYEPGGSDVDLLRRATVEAGARVVAPHSDGSQIPADLLPSEVSLEPDQLLAGRPQAIGAHEVIFFKPRWSAFYRTELEGWLKAQGVDTVVVAGCNLPNCPRATLFDASERDFRTVLAKDAVSQTTDERLSDLARIGVNVMDSTEINGALATHSP